MSDTVPGERAPLRGLMLVLIGIQLTLIGLFDGSSFIMIVLGVFVSITGLFDS